MSTLGKEEVPSNAGKVFVSYSHKNSEWMDRILLQLGVFQAEDALVAWNDRLIGAGAKWKEKLDAAIADSAVAVLLISANFLTSDFILTEEVPQLLACAEAGKLHLVPIVVEPCPWQRVEWLAKLQVRPWKGKPLSTFPSAETESEIVTIVNEIADMLKAAPTPQPPATQSIEPSSSGTPANATAEDAQQAEYTVTEITPLVGVPETRPVIAAFQRDFESTARLIKVISTYKELHDELQRFERTAFSDILSEHDRIGVDERAQKNLDAAAGELLALINQARALAERFDAPEPDHRIASVEPEMEWIKQLNDAHKFLSEGVKNQSTGSATAALAYITRVLDREPPRLDGEMFRHTDNLNFTPVERALEALRQRIASGVLRVETERELRDGIDALARLDVRFKDHMSQHHTWQTIEGELRLIEASTTGTLRPLAALWGKLKEQAGSYYSQSQEAWALGMQAAAAQLDAAIGARDPLGNLELRRRFLRFRRCCRDHFFFVDTTVREECGTLAQIGTKLELLARRIETDRS